ncbi:MAG: hypothetical protein ACO3P3_04785, partial [Candidatus Nanopelagicales bacterium]
MIDPQELEFGLDTFGDMQNDDSGKPISAGQTIRNVVEQAVFADSLRLDHFSIGEHHRDDLFGHAVGVGVVGPVLDVVRI